MKTVLGLAERRVGFEPKDYDLWIRAVLRAPDKQSLVNGEIEVPPRNVQQLYYLSDRDMIIITEDTNQIRRTAGSTQSARVLAYTDLLQALASS